MGTNVPYRCNLDACGQPRSNPTRVQLYTMPNPQARCYLPSISSGRTLPTSCAPALQHTPDQLPAPYPTGQVLLALESLLTEVARIRAHGLGPQELARAVSELQSEVENTALEVGAAWCRGVY